MLGGFQHKMGTLVDREIAEMAGVTVSAVTSYRRRHNIKASTSLAARANTVAVSNPVSNRRSVSRGYRVVIKGEAFVVIAKDIAEAAKARAAGRAVIGFSSHALGEFYAADAHKNWPLSSDNVVAKSVPLTVRTSISAKVFCRLGGKPDISSPASSGLGGLGCDGPCVTAGGVDGDAVSVMAPGGLDAESAILIRCRGRCSGQSRPLGR